MSWYAIHAAPKIETKSARKAMKSPIASLSLGRVAGCRARILGGFTERLSELSFRRKGGLHGWWQQVVAGDADRGLVCAEGVADDGVVLVCDQQQTDRVGVLGSAELVVAIVVTGFQEGSD